MSRCHDKSTPLQAKLHAAFFAGGPASLHSRLENHPMYKKQILVRNKQFKPQTLKAYFAAIYFYHAVLERRLNQCRPTEDIRPFFEGESHIASLFEAAHLFQDLCAMDVDVAGVRREHANTLVRDHIEALEVSKPHLLIGHLYLRYLGDLHGGSIIAGTLERKVRTVTSDAEYALNYLSPVKSMKSEARLTQMNGIARALNAVPQALHKDIVDEMKSAAEMTLKLFDSIAAAQQRSRCSSVQVLATVLLVAAVGLAVLMRCLPAVEHASTLTPG